MKLPFDNRSRERYFGLLNEMFDSNFWSEGQMVIRFEDQFSTFCGMPSLAVSNGGSALLALYTYAGVSGYEVIVPANTFYATAQAAKLAGAEVVYADCNKNDLCLSLEDVKRKVTKRTKAVCVVHIGGHIAFEIEAIAAFCQEKGIHLIEDCAHAHGATFNGKTAGSWGLGGAYSFYATKTMPTGEGGMLCSRDEKFLEWARLFRNYGKKVINGRVTYPLSTGFNYRMNEMTAALGIVQLENLPGILAWKKRLAAKYDRLFDRRVCFPEGMVSGYYKYIVFDYTLKEETGKVFAESDFGPEIEGGAYDLPNSNWVAEHHHCVPIWYGLPYAEESLGVLEELLLS
jgi:perosamine synthetase